MEEFLGGTDGNGGKGAPRELLRQLPGDRGNLVRDLPLAGQLGLRRLQLLRYLDDLLLLASGAIDFPLKRPLPA